MRLAASLRGFGNLALVEAQQLQHPDLKATNTRESPDAVSPVRHPACGCTGGELAATLEPLSWNVFSLKQA